MEGSPPARAPARAPALTRPVLVQGEAASAEQERLPRAQGSGLGLRGSRLTVKISGRDPKRRLSFTETADAVATRALLSRHGR